MAPPFLLWRLPFFSNFHLHLMGLEISDETGEVHLLPIVEFFEGGCLDFPRFGKSSNDLPNLLVIVDRVT